MNEAAAKKKVANFLQDLLYVTSFIQNHPDRIVQVILTDKYTYEELGRLTGDLFSLIEVIEGEAR